jgi:hypothetical protein
MGTMTKFFNARRALARFGLWSFVLGGCGPYGGPDCSSEMSDAGSPCEPDIDGQIQESDGGRLSGRVVPDPGGEWGVSGRAVRKGLRYDFDIRVPESFATTTLRVESSDPAVLAVTYESFDEECDGSFRLHGTLDYKGEGDAAVVVYDDRDELDRFTLTVQELDHIEVMAALEDADGGTALDKVVIDALTLDEPLDLQLVLRSASGAALAGDEMTYWTLDDHKVATFEGETIGRAPWTRIVPVAPGATALRLRSTGFELTIPVTVVGAPDTGSLENE